MLQQKLDSTIKHYNFLLSQKDITHADQLKKLEATYKNSWKWRIGSLFVESFIRCVNFVKNPVKYITAPAYRGSWAGIPDGAEQSVSNPVGNTKLNVQTKASESIQNVIDTAAKSIKAESTPINLISDIKNDQKVQPARKGNKPVVAAILDEIHEQCLDPELTLLSFRPDNWREQLDHQIPDFVLVESALKGNAGSWQYKIATADEFSSDDLKELLLWAKDHNTPSLFWFTGDPISSELYYKRAQQCEYILTANVEEIPKYKEIFGHDRIIPFPNCVQSKLHNPITDVSRDLNICFPARNFNNKVNGNRKAIEMLINSSFASGLEIWDENFGDCLTDSYGKLYPEFALPYIKGRLRYAEMSKAYHRYKVVFNSDSGQKSLNGISRRVLESLACGTPVISTYSKAMDAAFGEAVLFAETESDTKKHLDMLLHDELAWIKASVSGIRQVLEGHRFDIRLQEALNRIGIAYASRTIPSIGLLIDMAKIKKTDLLAQMILVQTYKPSALILLSETTDNASLTAKLTDQLGSVKVFAHSYYQNQLNKVVHQTAGCDYYAVWNPGDVYGPNYLKDYALATLYNDNGSFGKNSYYQLQSKNLVEKINGNQFMFTNQVPVSTLMVSGKKLSSFNFLLMTEAHGNYESFLPDILALDSLNFVENQHPEEELNKQKVRQYFA